LGGRRKNGEEDRKILELEGGVTSHNWWVGWLEYTGFSFVVVLGGGTSGAAVVYLDIWRQRCRKSFSNVRGGDGLSHRVVFYTLLPVERGGG